MLIWLSLVVVFFSASFILSFSFIFLKHKMIFLKSTKQNKVNVLAREAPCMMSGAAAAGALFIGQFNLTETQALVVKVSLLTNRTRGQRTALPPSHSRFFFPASAIFLRLSLFLALLIVGCHGNKSTGRGGLLLLKQLWDW